jgi:hypothetical protein
VSTTHLHEVAPHTLDGQLKERQMAIAVTQDFEGATLDQYDHVIAKMGLEPGGKHSDPACLFHWVTATDSGLRVVDVWATREHFETFVNEQVAPRALEAGFPNQPVNTFYDVHTYLG